MLAPRRPGPYGGLMGWGRRLTCAATIGMLVTTIAACTAISPRPVVTRLPDDAGATPAPSTTTQDSPSSSRAPSSTDAAGDGTIDCAGAPLTVTVGSGVATVVGDCPELRVEGSGLELDASAAQVAALATGGDGISVRIGVVASVTVQGNHTVVEGGEIAALLVSGDDNGVSTTGDIDSATVSGNGNTVRAARVSSVAVSGSGNSIG